MKTFNAKIGASLVLVVLSIVSGTSTTEKCHPKNFGNGATVCVCNLTHCDTLSSIVRSPSGEVQIFVSSIDGDRFKNEPKQQFTRSSKTNQKTLASADANTISIHINSSIKYQQIIGFGGAFTDATGINLVKLPKEMQNRIIKDYYGTSGAGYTIGRIPIGGSDFSTRPYTYDDHENDETLEKFALQLEDRNYKIPFLKLAYEYSSKKARFIGSPWSAPTWMKTNHEIIHGGLLIGKPGEKYYKLFAQYLVKWLEVYIKNESIPIWGLTIENEPGAGFNPFFAWNSLGFNGTLQRDFIKLDLGPILKQNGFTKENLKVLIYDDQLPNIKSFSDTVLSDIDAAQYVSGIAFHWYNNANGNRTDLDWLTHKYSNAFILATEASEEWKGHKHHVSLGNWAAFNRYSEDILLDLNHYVTGWTDWNLALDTNGGPNWVGNFVDAPIIINATAQEYYKQPFFYAMAHFAKPLVPGSRRIHFDEVNQVKDKNVLITVFERPDHSKVVTVLNKNHHPITLNINDPSNGQVNVTVKAQALQTILWY